jgi:hypothetical protein
LGESARDVVDGLGPLKLALARFEAKTKTQSGIRSTGGQLHFELAPKVVSDLKAESPAQLSLNGRSHVPEGEVCKRGAVVGYGSSQRVAHFAKGFVPGQIPALQVAGGNVYAKGGVAELTANRRVHCGG